MKKSNWLLICCMALTAFVVIIATRIEMLNVEGQYVLPRATGSSSEAVDRWVIPEIDVVIERLDEQFFEQRQHVAAITASEQPTSEQPTAEQPTSEQPATAQPIQEVVKYGPPYSAQEEKFITSVKKLHAAHTNILWWLKSFGRAQYFLAPAALFIAVLCAVSLSGWLPKSTAGMCACLNIGSIVLMLTRSYWQSIGA